MVEIPMTVPDAEERFLARRALYRIWLKHHSDLDKESMRAIKRVLGNIAEICPQCFENRHNDQIFKRTGLCTQCTGQNASDESEDFKV